MTGQGDAGNRWCLASTAEAAKPLQGNSMCLELSGEHRDEDRQGGTERGRQHPWLGSRHGQGMGRWSMVVLGGEVTKEVKNYW